MNMDHVYLRIWPIILALIQVVVGIQDPLTDKARYAGACPDYKVYSRHAQ